MEKIRTSLVLEGGGMRGAYTAGALSWLIENNIEFDSAYGISTGAVHLCNYLMKNSSNLFSFAIDYITDKRVVGVKPFLRSGRIVDYDFLFDDFLSKQIGFDISPLKDCKAAGKIGLYELDKGQTEYHPVQNISMDELKAACSLPLIGKVVKYNDRHILDGGITEMIPINKSVEDGNDVHLIITTKPGDFVRKPSKKFVVSSMKINYPKWPSVAEDYAIRHLNYQKQIATIKQLENEKKAIYIYPSESSNVSRLGGKREELVKLFELGKSDMEAHKKEIFALLNKNV